MKHFVILAVVLAAVAAIPMNPRIDEDNLSESDILAILGMLETRATIDESIENKIECMRRNIPDPFDDEHQDVDFNIGTLFALEGTFDEASTRGLSAFKINKVHFSPLTLKMDFDFSFSDVAIVGKYDLSGLAVGFIPVFGAGPFVVKPKEISIAGHLKLGVRGGFLFLSEFNLVPKIKSIELAIQGLIGGGDLSLLLNEVLMDILPGLLDYWQPDLTASLEDTAKEIANPILSTMTLSDILESITGDGENCMPE